LAITIVVLSIIAAGVNKSQATADTHESAIQQQVEEAAEALPQPAAADFQTENAGE
jgi:hypothetical protein